MKKLLKLVVVLAVLVIVGVLVALFYVDAIAQTAIEKGSTAAMGVETTLKTAKLKVFKGQLVMDGLNVANPGGYQSNHFLNLKDGDVAVSLGSLTGDVVEVPHLKLDGIDINLEKKDGKANYQVILDNLKGSETDTKPESKEGKRFKIAELTITNVDVHISGMSVLGKLDVPIDEIALKNVGSDSDKGLLLKDISGIIVKAVFTAIVQKAGGIIPADILGDLQSGLAQLTDLSKLADIAKLGDVGKAVGDLGQNLGKNLGEAGKNLGGEAEKIGDKAKDAAKDVTDKIGDIIGGKKKDK